MTVQRRLSATLAEARSGGGRWVEVPLDAREAFGEARPPVRGTVAGHHLRGRLAICARRAYLGLTRELRTAAGLELGDVVEVALERDDQPREVEVPAELARALASDKLARTAYDRVACTQCREYASWVAEAKRAETRESRAARVEPLHQQAGERAPRARAGLHDRTEGR